MYIRTVKQKIDFCSDQCCYSSHCSFGVKGDFLYECLVYVNINGAYLATYFPEKGVGLCVSFLLILFLLSLQLKD